MLPITPGSQWHSQCTPTVLLQRWTSAAPADVIRVILAGGKGWRYHTRRPAERPWDGAPYWLQQHWGDAAVPGAISGAFYFGARESIRESPPATLALVSPASPPFSHPADHPIPNHLRSSPHTKPLPDGHDPMLCDDYKPLDSLLVLCHGA